MQRSLFLLIVMMTSVLMAQEDFNQFDSNGERHGKWRKFFEGTEQLRYEGEFKHGKEVGQFFYYAKDTGTMPIAIKVFDETTGVAAVKYFARNRNLISEGQFKGKQRVGEWKYYHRNSKQLLSTEHYVNGVLSGQSKTFYPSGLVSDVKTYANGKLNGTYKKFSEYGIMLEELQYKEDVLQGAAKYYTPKGILSIEGTYKSGRKGNIWYYYEGETLVKEIDYANWNKPITILHQ